MVLSNVATSSEFWKLKLGGKRSDRKITITLKNLVNFQYESGISDKVGS